MVSRVLFADISARYGFDCSKTEPSLVPPCRIIRCAAPRQGRDVEPRRPVARARPHARLQHLQAQQQPSVDDGGARDRHGRRRGASLRRVRRHRAENFAAFGGEREPRARRQRPGRDRKLKGFAARGRRGGGKLVNRNPLGGERARREPEQTHRQRRDRQMPPHSCRQLVRTVILATWGDVAVARTRGLGATPGAGSSGTTRTSRGTLASGAAAATGRFSGSGTVNVVGRWTGWLKMVMPPASIGLPPPCGETRTRKRRPWSAGPRFKVTSATRGGACGAAVASAAAGTCATPPAGTPAPIVADVICALKARVAGNAATGVPGAGT